MDKSIDVKSVLVVAWEEQVNEERLLRGSGDLVGEGMKGFRTRKAQWLNYTMDILSATGHWIVCFKMANFMLCESCLKQKTIIRMIFGVSLSHPMLPEGYSDLQ